MAERYAYDAAGNILEKEIAGKMTTYRYDEANQLVSSTAPDGTVTKYVYDAAGRMTREGAKTYRYGYLDKVLAVTEGKERRTFTYHADGQLATAIRTGGPRSVAAGTGRAASPLAAETETFLWDGLALIRRGTVSYVNEPHPNGGSPILSSKDGVMFNDILGTTMGTDGKDGYAAASLTAFGDSAPGGSRSVATDTLFTGKPHVDGLGYAFLFRNYRPGLGKWQTADPLGYPDGWNRLAYCGNDATLCIDIIGASAFDIFMGDDQGIELLDWWLSGTGTYFFRGEYSDWANYMRANKMLATQVEKVLLNDVLERTVSGFIDKTFHVEIENGYRTGYELLHGSNASVGDFRLYGNVNVRYVLSKGIYKKILTYDLYETWNDVIDPNENYWIDRFLSKGLSFLYSPKDFQVKLKWYRQWVFEFGRPE